MKKIFIPTILLTVSLLFIFSCDRKKVNSTTKSNKSEIDRPEKKVVKTEHKHSASCPCGSHLKETSSTNSVITSADDNKIEQEVNKFSDKLKLDSLTLEEQEEYIKNVMSTSTFQKAVQHCRNLRWSSLKLGIKFAEHLLKNSQNDVEKALAMSVLGTLIADKVGLIEGYNSKYDEVKILLKNTMEFIKEQFAEHNELLYSMQNVIWSLNSIYIEDVDKNLAIAKDYFEMLKDYNGDNQEFAEESVRIPTYQGIFMHLKFAQQHNHLNKIKLSENNLKHLIDFARKMTKEDWPYGLEHEKRPFSEYKKETLKNLNQYQKEVYGK